MWVTFNLFRNNKTYPHTFMQQSHLILACTEGTEGHNDYGSDPKRPEILDEIELIGNN